MQRSTQTFLLRQLQPEPLKEVLRPTAEAEQDNYILQIHDMICQCTHAVSMGAQIAQHSEKVQNYTLCFYDRVQVNYNALRVRRTGQRFFLF